jgi:hypothetical protein
MIPTAPALPPRDVLYGSQSDLMLACGKPIIGILKGRSKWMTSRSPIRGKSAVLKLLG